MKTAEPFTPWGPSLRWGDEPLHPSAVRIIDSGMPEIAPLEMNLDELRMALAPLIPAHAVFDGWSDKALGMAAAELGVPAPRARLAFPGGATEMIDAWFDAIDRAMAAAFPLEKIEAMKIRERIASLVMFRLEVINPHKEALRRALAILARRRICRSPAGSAGAPPTGCGGSPATRRPTSTIIPSAPS